MNDQSRGAQDIQLNLSLNYSWLKLISALKTIKRIRTAASGIKHGITVTSLLAPSASLNNPSLNAGS